MKQLQYITHHNGSIGYLEGAKLALDGGCHWIQLRMKDAEDEEYLSIARELRQLCTHFGATFILDDRVELVELVGADGVHLGQHDMPVNEARTLLGTKKIIGGTANTIEEIVRLAKLGADYIGCGPFRFTHTKEKLAPTLGLEGYRRITQAMRKLKIHLPIVAIGGIQLDDVPALLQTGVDGIAVSGAILQSADPAETTKQFINLLNHSQYESGL